MSKKPIKIDTKELARISRKFKRLQKKVVTNVEIALFNASGEVQESAKKVHLFKTQTSKLENSIFIDVKGLSSTIFTPIDGALGVPYAGFIDSGRRKTEDGFAIWADQPKGDQYIANAFKREEKTFLRIFKEDLTDELQEDLK